MCTRERNRRKTVSVPSFSAVRRDQRVILCVGTRGWREYTTSVAAVLVGFTVVTAVISSDDDDATYDNHGRSDLARHRSSHSGRSERPLFLLTFTHTPRMHSGPTCRLHASAAAQRSRVPVSGDGSADNRHESRRAADGVECGGHGSVPCVSRRCTWYVVRGKKRQKEKKKHRASPRR